jgi:hypothetical protein
MNIRYRPRQKVLRDLKISVERYARMRPHKNQANTERFVDTLHKAGLK